MPKFLSEDRIVYPRATLLHGILQYHHALLCCDLLYELRYWLPEQISWAQTDECCVVAEYRVNKQRKATCKIYGSESQIVILEGWDHESFDSWSVLHDDRKLRFRSAKDWATAFDEYLKFIRAKGAIVLADFRRAPLPPRVIFMGRDFPKGALPDDFFIDLPAEPTTNGQEVSDKSLEQPTDPVVDENMASSEAAIVEGAALTILINRYERDPLARRRCIEHFGLACQICRIEFSRAYPGIGEGYIHVHHLVPISSIGRSYSVDPVRDLIPVCPNCHAMIHRKDPPYTPDEIKVALLGAQPTARASDTDY